MVCEARRRESAVTDPRMEFAREAVATMYTCPPASTASLREFVQRLEMVGYMPRGSSQRLELLVTIARTADKASEVFGDNYASDGQWDAYQPLLDALCAFQPDTL